MFLGVTFGVGDLDFSDEIDRLLGLRVQTVYGEAAQNHASRYPEADRDFMIVSPV
jgi:hypothetical protein